MGPMYPLTLEAEMTKGLSLMALGKNTEGMALLKLTYYRIKKVFYKQANHPWLDALSFVHRS